MEQRRETKPSMLRRCLGWDYRQPSIYMVTLVLADRRSQALGRLVIPGASAPGTGQACSVPGAEAPDLFNRAAASHIALSPAGEAVMREWRGIASHHPDVKPLFMQVMPDHVHFILQVLRPMAKPLGNVIGGFKAGSSKAATGGPGLWAEGFQDTILFNEGQLDAMFRYLRDNPRRLAVKRLCQELFKVVKGLKLPLQAQNRPLQSPCSVPGAEAPGTGYFSAIGNLFLLDAPTKLQVLCSRSIFGYSRSCRSGHKTDRSGHRADRSGSKIERDGQGQPLVAFSTAEFEAKRDELLAAAKHGAVLVSPCISDGEREIARLAFAAGASVIALRNMGFSPLYKPGGKLFEKTANGNLLLLAPAAWPYQTAEKPMTRFDACVLNRIAQLIAGDGAAEINYKGMKPDDIDRLVREAVGRRV